MTRDPSPKPALERLADLNPLADHALDSVATGPEAQVLFEQIIDAPGAEAGPSGDAKPQTTLSRRRSFALAAGLAVATVVVAIVIPRLPGGDPGVAAAGVHFRADGGSIVARITDPFAAEEELDAAFAAEGLAISVDLKPVSPSLVGTVLMISESAGGPPIESIGGGPCVTGGGTCPIGLRIPRGFEGSGQISLGRPAKSGEEYVSSTDAFAPGEALHCLGAPGTRVGRLLPALAANYATVDWRGRDGEALDGAPPAGHVVTNVIPGAADSATVSTSPDPADATRHSTPEYRAELVAGC